MTKEDFENKVKTVRPRLISYAIHVLGNREEAEDVTQDVLLKMWFMRFRLETYNSFEGVAFIMLRNRVINTIRDKKKFEVLTDDLNDNNLYNGIEVEGLPNEIMSAIETLPTVEQAVMRLKHLEGFENDEIAAMIGSTPGAVRTALARARKKMRDRFLEHK